MPRGSWTSSFKSNLLIKDQPASRAPYTCTVTDIWYANVKGEMTFPEKQLLTFLANDI